MRRLRLLFATTLVAAVSFGMVSVLTPMAFAAPGNGNGNGGGNGGGPPGPGNPPACPCAEVISPAPGVVCTLDWCVEYVPGGYECGYVCTFPF